MIHPFQRDLRKKITQMYNDMMRETRALNRRIDCVEGRVQSLGQSCRGRSEKYRIWIRYEALLEDGKTRTKKTGDCPYMVTCRSFQEAYNHALALRDLGRHNGNNPVIETIEEV